MWVFFTAVTTLFYLLYSTQIMILLDHSFPQPLYVQQYALPTLCCASITKHDIPFANTTEKNYCQIIFNSAFADLIFSTTLRLYFVKPKV